MKLDLYQWGEVREKEYHARPGRLQLRFSAPVALYGEAQGYQALVGYAAAFDLDLSETVTFTFEGKARWFASAPYREAETDHGEVFTNIDREPYESGPMMEVTAALRRLKLQEREMTLRLRAEAAAVLAAKLPPADPVKADSAQQDANESEVIE